LAGWPPSSNLIAGPGPSPSSGGQTLNPSRHPLLDNQDRAAALSSVSKRPSPATSFRVRQHRHGSPHPAQVLGRPPGLGANSRAICGGRAGICKGRGAPPVHSERRPTPARAGPEQLTHLLGAMLAAGGGVVLQSKTPQRPVLPPGRWLEKGGMFSESSCCSRGRLAPGRGVGALQPFQASRSALQRIFEGFQRALGGVPSMGGAGDRQAPIHRLPVLVGGAAAHEHFWAGRAKARAHGS